MTTFMPSAGFESYDLKLILISMGNVFENVRKKGEQVQLLKKVKR